MAPEQFREERDIDLRTGHEVVSINSDEQSVTTEHATGEITQRYNHLVIVTGAEATVLPIDGTDLEGGYTLFDD